MKRRSVQSGSRAARPLLRYGTRSWWALAECRLMVDAAGCCSVFVCSAPTQTLKLRAAAPPPTPPSPHAGTRDRVWGRLQMIRSECSLPCAGLVGRPVRPRTPRRSLSSAPLLQFWSVSASPCLCFSQSPLFSLQPPGKNRTDAESALMRPNPHSWGERGFTLSVSFLVKTTAWALTKPRIHGREIWFPTNTLAELPAAIQH